MSEAIPVRVSVPPIKLEKLIIPIEGTTQYVQHKFSQKAEKQIKATQEAGSRSGKGTKREPRNFEADYKASMYVSEEGWQGIPADGFRKAMISACRIVGFAMTRAKLSVFVEADGLDKETKRGLVKITKGKPHMRGPEPVRNDNGSIDLRARAEWDAGWRANVTVTYDTEQFSKEDIVNLMSRVGVQVGIGEGRYDSKDSGGMGWGCFQILAKEAA